MIETKIIEIGVDVQDPINLYTDDENIRQILADRLEGMCIRGCYIIKIEKIKRNGRCVINQEGPPNFGTIPIICEVTALVYSIGEIINGCVVTNRDKNGIIICSKDTASIMLAPHPALESVTKGQIISVRVGAVKNAISSPKISINAVPYLFSDKPIIYKIGPMSDAIRGLLANVMERINTEEEKMEKMKKENEKAWTTFEQLLYAYKEVQKPPSGAKVMDLKEVFKTGAAGVAYLSRDSRINLSTPTVYGYSAGTAFPAGARVKDELAPAAVYIILFEDYCSHLRTIREMVEIYSTEKIIADHKNLWQIFRKNKF